MSNLKAVLKGIKSELEKKDKVRENAQYDMRKATSLSKQAILLIHQKKIENAKKLLENAEKLMLKLSKASEAYPEIIYNGLFYAARQEYSEANILLKLTEESRFATPDEIKVPSVDYILGLADVIGEYRRIALDALREGNLEKGEKCLWMMEEIYVGLMALDEAYTLVPGLRRKCDVARKILESTRGDITQEIRRNMLEKNLRRLERLIEKKK